MSTTTKIVKKRAQRKGPLYGSYIHKVFKQVHPEVPGQSGLNISTKAMDIINQLIMHIETQVSRKSVEMAKYQKKNTLSSRHVQAAVKVLLPGEIANNAIAEGTKAVTKFGKHP
jgi:histone H3/H4